MLAALTDSDVRALQRDLRGRSESVWLDWRARHIGLIVDFLERYPDRLRGNQRDARVARVLKLAAWQLCLDWELTFDGLARGADRKRRKPLRAAGYAARALLEIQATLGTRPTLWPFEIGSPFARGA